MMSDALSRRDFFALGAATLAGVTLGEAGRRWLARVEDRSNVWQAQGAESWATSVCRECPGSCGVRVRLVDNVPVKLEGNPLCPVGRGRLCALGQAALESYFDPDRLVGPARRVGPRGEQRFEKISWDEALQLFTARLDRARQAHRGIVAMAAEERGPLAGAWTEFWSNAGGRVVWHLDATSERLAPRLRALTGADGVPVFDVERASYVLSFNAPLVEDWLSPVWAQRSYGRFRRGAARPRGRLVHIEERRSLTARKADEWLPVGGDRQAFLAYGIASVLLREDRIDRARLAEIGGNFTEFEREITDRFTPDSVAVAAGVPVVTLLRLARELAATPQPLAIVAADAPPDLVDAVFALNAVIGAFDRPGGLYEAAAGSHRGSALLDATRELAQFSSAATAPAFVALRDAASLRAISTPHDIASTFDRCEFIVSFSPYLDEAASVADLLLPTHTSLESWHGVAPPLADTTEKVACTKPAAPARLDTRDLFQVLSAAATGLGDKQSPEWKSSADLVNAELDRLWKLRRGTPYANVFQTDWINQLEEGGWWVPPAGSRDEFAKVVLSAGGWADPFFAAGTMRQRLVRRGGLSFLPPATPVDPYGDVQRAANDVSGDPARAPQFPLRLIAFTPAAVNLRGSFNQPSLFELLGAPESEAWHVWAELAPETARAAGLEKGSRVRITAPAAAIEATVVVVERMPLDTIAVAYVPGQASGGRWSGLLTRDVRRLWAHTDAARPVNVRITRV